MKDAIANGDKYSVVVGRLKKVLDKLRELYLWAVKAILKIGQLDYDKAGLSTLTTDLLKNYNTFIKYGDGSMSQILTAIIELKMPDRLKQEWTLHHAKPSPNLLSFHNWTSSSSSQSQGKASCKLPQPRDPHFLLKTRQ